MHLVVHLGPHKTGTTYMQTRLSQHRAVLDERGWVYPTHGTRGKEGHHEIAYNADIYLRPDEPKSVQLAAIGEACRAAGKSMLLSAEGFRFWKIDHLEALVYRLGATTVDLVYVVRCPYSVFYSYWAEEVKQGLSSSLSFRFMQNFTDPFKSQILNPFVDINRLGLDPRFRVNVIYYDAARKREMDLCDILTNDILGIGTLPPSKFSIVNESFPIELTEFLRLLTFRHTRTKRFTNSAFRLAFTSNTTQEERDEIVKVIKDKASSAFRAYSLSRDNFFYKELRKRLADSAFHRKLPADGHIDIPDDAVVWRVGDIGMLMNCPEVVQLVEKYEARLKPLFPSPAGQ